MSINPNNLTDIDDSSLLENTPMMVVEQDGNRFAIPAIVNVQRVNVTQEVALDGPNVVIDRVEAFTLYRCGSIASLTVETLGNAADDATIVFTAGDGFTANFPADLAWVTAAEFSTGRSYVVAICAGLAAAAEVL